MELTDKRVLVTGGAGFIGSQVVADLLDVGAHVHVVDNLFTGDRALVADQAELTETDIRSDELLDVLGRFDPHAIVHLAAIHYVPYCDENPEEAFDVNVMGTRSVVEAARSLDKLEHLLFASTAGVYPASGGAIAEDDPTGPLDIYGKTKLVGEDLVELFVQETGVPAVGARLFNAYGPNETNPHLIPAIYEQLEDGDEVNLGNLTPKRDFIHVRDLASALLAILGEFDGQFRTYNVGTGTAYSVREVAETIGEALGRNVDIVQDEDRMRESDRPHLQADISRIREEIGWEPEIEFVEGLSELSPGQVMIS